MMRLFSRTPLADTDFRAADAMTIRAVRRERPMLRSTYPVDFDLYERTLLDKRCSGVLASVALARIGGLGPRRCRAVRATLESVIDGPPDLRRRRRLGDATCSAAAPGPCA